MKIIITVRFTFFDKHFIYHYFNYYINLGISFFLINFNYKILYNNSISDSDDELQSMIDYILNLYSYNSIIIKYNIGPNGIQYTETDNIKMLNKLVNQYADLENDFIIPSDCDELHEYKQNLYNKIILMNEKKIDYLYGQTYEHISENGFIKELIDYIDIFMQFPKWNNELYSKSKISLIRAKYYKFLYVGHHYLHNDNVKEYNINRSNETITHHFRWNIQNISRISNWIKIFSEPNYKGYNGIVEYTHILSIMNNNLILYKKN